MIVKSTEICNPCTKSIAKQYVALFYNISRKTILFLQTFSFIFLLYFFLKNIIKKYIYILLLAPPKPETSTRSSKSSSATSKSKKEILENFPFTLVCPFSGYPVLQFSWMKDGQSLNPAINPYFSTADGGKRLEVKHAKANHAGKYTCIAKNEGGESVKDFLVDILGENYQLFSIVFITFLKIYI